MSCRIRAVEHRKCMAGPAGTHPSLQEQILQNYTRIENMHEVQREREFIGTNIKQFHAIIKLRRWDTEKNLQNRFSVRAPLESFINFYRGLKLMAELVRI